MTELSLIGFLMFNPSHQISASLSAEKVKTDAVKDVLAALLVPDNLVLRLF